MCKIAICDDDKEYREKIKTVIETEGILSSNEIRFYEYESGKELLEDADILHDLIFMDMRMPGLDGNKTVLKLREYNEAAILVFCSGCFEPTPDSINVGQPFRYIMKDLHDRSLKKEIPMILLKVKLCCGDSSVTVTSAGRIMRIHTEDILYICLAKRGCTIYIARQGKIEEMHCKESLSDLYWIHWLNHENITLWNSVPAFVEMLAEYEEYQRQVTSQSLRLVMMSGDWVPVSLPGRIRNLFQNVEIVALGGATEGSIDEKVGTMYLYPIISKDFRRVCKETGVKEGCFFNTFSDLSSMASFFEIGSKIYHSNSMDTFGYTEQLEKMYRNKSTENEKTIFWFGIELVNGNDVEKKLMSFEYACNWNSLSGYVCALVAEWCLNDEISKGKAYNLDEIEGIQKFIESLPGEIKQNIVKL